ncbi:synaptobrevin [Apiospora marii]|uniref:synaptobrevin n=1 Tax=Apiospora marii TaxID=335849 RepID=UPI00312F59B7
MARLTQEPMTPRRSVSNPDSLTDLNRLLARLQQNVLQANAEQERRLRTSEYERNKVGINLEYARTLLTKVEQDASSVKVHARRQDLQADLNRKREVFEQLAERLRELEDLSIDSDEEDESDEDSEDLLAGIIHTPSESPNPRRPDDDENTGRDASFEQGEDDEAEITVLHVPQSATSSQSKPTATVQPTAPASRTSEQPGTATSQTVRTRGKGGAETSQAGAYGGDTADTTARNQLFGSKPSSATTALSTTATTEALLDHQRDEQDKLTESLLGMASALKSSSRAFATSLEEEKDVLASATTGLDKNERGLEAAARRMGTLRKMSEGRGMIGRYILMATIAGMWVLALLLVFAMPKLRF